jgi:SAM-dependent methyltransferase
MDIKEWKSQALSSARRHPWERARSAVIFDLLKSVFPDRHAKIRILDFGCGDLSVARDISALYPQSEFIGIDQAYSEADLIERMKTLNQDVKLTGPVGLFVTLEDAEKYLCQKNADDGTTTAFHADVVFLLDVLEHCEDDVAVLRRIAQSPLLSANAAFLMTVPAHQELWSKHDIFLDHFRRYTVERVRTMITGAGFAPPVKEGYFFCSLLFVRWIQVFIESRVKSLVFPWSDVGSNQAPPVLNAIVVWVLAFDYHVGKFLRWLNLPSPGLSSFAVFYRRKAGI